MMDVLNVKKNKDRKYTRFCVEATATMMCIVCMYTFGTIIINVFGLCVDLSRTPQRLALTLAC